MLTYHDESRVFLHEFAGYEPPDMFAFRSDRPAPEILEPIVDRLIAYYHHLSSESEARRIGGTWSQRTGISSRRFARGIGQRWPIRW